MNGDGWLDLCFTENLYAREPETGLWRGGVGTCLLGGKEGLTALSPAASGFLVPGDGKGLAALSLGDSTTPALIALQNNDRLLAFVANPDRPSTARRLAVRLSGPPGNPTAVGARVTLKDGNRPVLVSEINAGSSAQSQSSATLFLTLPPDVPKPRLAIRWPNGTETSVTTLPPRGGLIELSSPP